MNRNLGRMLLAIAACTGLVALVGVSCGRADPPVPQNTAGPATPAAPSDAKPSATEKPDADAKPQASGDIVWLSKDHDLWLNKKRREVGLTGKIAVREGNLENLACPAGTKDYESIIATNQKSAKLIHAALIAAGAKPGHPSTFDTKFHPAAGAEIDIAIRWTDSKGEKHKAKAQEWVKNMKTGKELEYPWVFAGSFLRTDAATGEKYYEADGGDLISVVNFPDSMLDLGIESPRAWENHVFEPFTDRIPPKGTEVELLLTPKPEQKAPAHDDKAAKDGNGANPNKPAETQPARDSSGK